MDSSQTLRSMTIVLNRDNPVEALRAVALPWALGGDLDFQFCACEALLRSLCAGGQTKQKRKKPGNPDFTFTPLLGCQLLLFDLLFQVLRAGLRGGLLTVKSVLLIDGIGEHDGATLSVDHLHAGSIV